MRISDWSSDVCSSDLFAGFFLQTCIDQVTFMESLVRPDRLRERILIWTEEEIRGDRLPLQSSTVLEAVLYRGSLTRGELAPLLNAGTRHARRITAALLDRGLFTAHGPRPHRFLN